MKNQLIMLAACASLAITACKKESNLDLNANKNTAAADISITGKTKVVIDAAITVSDTLTADKVYELVGQIVVKNDAILTIEPGTIIYGRASTGQSATGAPGALIIAQGSKLIAVGTETNPIVFTSYRKVDNDATTAPIAGDFGGVVLLGKASTNLSASATIEGVAASLASDCSYGGPAFTNDNDNSGTLQYVRIEYAGFAIAANQEINGLTCGGVGSGTTIDHIEVYYGKDDAFEFFGGTVNASYLLAYAQEDDGLDFDNGYRGTINYAVIISDLAGSHTANDSNAIECDNNSTGTATVITTKPVLNHITVVGAKVPASWNTTTVANGALLYGARFRRMTKFDMQNSVIIGYPNALRVEGGAGRYLVGIDSTRTQTVRGETVTVAVTGKYKTGSRTSVFANNYVSSFQDALSYAVGIADYTGGGVYNSGDKTYTYSGTVYSPLAATIVANAGVTMLTSMKNIVNPTNTSNSNYNETLAKYAYVQPFVNATGAVNLTPVKGASAIGGTMGHLAATKGLDGISVKPTWGKNWTAGVYGF